MDQIRYPAPTPPRREGFSVPPAVDFNGSDFRGSIQKVLGNNVGQYVVMEFLIGTEQLVRKQGILYFVGTDYVVLYDDVVDNFIVCDLYAIKFTYFYYPGQRPTQNYNTLPSAPTVSS
ncbi:MAG: hypothetical protein IJC84_03420 [Clostridia bacterium]|nr:hypothetical protein [Clostridia bacterium]